MTWSILPDTVTAVPASDTPELVAAPTAEALAALPADLTAEVFPIDPELADTAALTEAYGLAPEHSANCVLVAGTRADVNKRVRKLLDVRKASFLPMDRAVEESGMEYGGIGPIGLPEGYRLLVDARVVAADEVIIGSGIRGSKIILPGSEVARLPGAEVIEDLALEV